MDLYLKEDHLEYLETHKIKELIKKHNAFINYFQFKLKKLLKKKLKTLMNPNKTLMNPNKTLMNPNKTLTNPNKTL